jgi:glutamate N-acetyltransferase/amino-acid N-acetyltransferase
VTTLRERPLPGVGAERALAPLPSDLPPVERRAVIPGGFVAGGMRAGIKASERPDLALIAKSGVASLAAAAVYTPNRFAAAPVRLSQANLASTGGEPSSGRADVVICTSGCANAATGPAGDADQAAVGRIVAAATGSAEDHILHLSTGIIGTRLPLDRVEPAVAALASRLESTDEGLLAAAEALRTTDSVTKVATVSVDGVRVTGIAKGVGMIHPRMATMLSVLLTDADASPAVLRGVLRRVVARTWNQISVDGDTSTNDTVFLLASGASGVSVDADAASRAVFAKAVEAVARDLARQQAADGEGATALITCQVSGARDDADARAVARAVISSSLVKAAVHGRDPNWGRLAGAAGNATLPDAAVLSGSGLSADEARTRGGSAAALDPETLRIAIAGHLVYDGAAGGPVPFDRAAARESMGGKEVLFRLDLGLGDGVGEAFGCDLTETYVRENSEYTT